MTQKLLKLPKGIVWEGNSTYVEFVFKQLKCREKIPYLKPVESELIAAEAFKIEIESKIENNTFNYKLEFPKSKYWKILERVQSIKGLEIHRNSIRLNFTYQGSRRRESLRNIDVTLSNLKFAENKLHTINFEIVAGKFNYAEHFPHSKTPVKLGLIKDVPTVAQACDVYLKAKENEGIKDIRKYRGYVNNYINPKFGERKLDTILPTEIENWQKGELLKDLSPKSIRNMMIPFQSIFKLALKDRIIDFDPFHHAEKIKCNSTNKADPFTLAELQIIEQQETFYESEKNAFLFACWSGVRLSEWLALSWSDVDFENRTLAIKRAFVDNKLSVPKNLSSERTIDLLDQAFEILLKQKEITYHYPTLKLKKLDWDKHSYVDDEIHPIFVNSNNKKLYGDGGNMNKTFFAPFLEKCGLRYRGINQARHTYGSQMLTKGIAERWIASQMGHVGTEMLQKHYGKLIKSEIPDMARKVSNMFLR